MNETQFKIPAGYKCWCHLCGEPPFNKVTEVRVEDGPVSMQDSQLLSGKIIKIPGLGFHSIDELTKHTKDVHRTWKG
jgi:hypothetical protein